MVNIELVEKENKDILKSLLNKYIELKMINKKDVNLVNGEIVEKEELFFYHGKLADLDDNFIKIDDFKTGRIYLINRSCIKTIKVMNNKEVNHFISKLRSIANQVTVDVEKDLKQMNKNLDLLKLENINKK